MELEEDNVRILVVSVLVNKISVENFVTSVLMVSITSQSANVNIFECNLYVTYCNKIIIKTYFTFKNFAACQCNEIGSRNLICDQKTGQCSCHSSYGNLSCDQCNHGYYGFPACTCNIFHILKL